MCHFGVNINFKTESFLCLNIIFFCFIKFICIAAINIYSFIYLFKLCIPRSAHILYLVRVKSRLIQNSTTVYVILSFFSYLLGNTINHVARRKCLIYVQYVSNLFLFLFHFWSQSMKKHPDFETSRCIKAEYLYELK